MELVIAFLLLAQSAETPQMTTGGWVFMIGAWAAIFSLVVFCFSKILGRRNNRE